jgi:hypothetical protein
MTEKKLVLETRNQGDGSTVSPGLLMTPPVGEDYWSYRVMVGRRQAVIGFPKFTTIGIGFAREEDWNTNLPYIAETEKIFQHIKHNKGDGSISDDDVRAAIAMIQDAVRAEKKR